MNEGLKLAAQRYRKALAAQTPEEKFKRAEEGYRRSVADHAIFQKAFKTGRCFVCGESLDSFDRAELCVHWLLRPQGCTKSDIAKVLEGYSLFRIQAYLRWVANENGIGININDLSDEGSGKLIELTIRYKDLEWSFSCGRSDYDGHSTSSPLSQQPHYHFQMRVKKQAFLKFRDLHIALAPDDILNIEAMLDPDSPATIRFAGGMGMGDVLNDDMVETLVREGLSAADGSQEAPLRVQTLLIADEGTMISGDDLADLAREAREKGVTLASLIHKLPNASAQMFVEPGPGVVEQAVRTGGRQKKKDG